MASFRDIPIQETEISTRISRKSSGKSPRVRDFGIRSGIRGGFGMGYFLNLDPEIPGIFFQKSRNPGKIEKKMKIKNLGIFLVSRSRNPGCFGIPKIFNSGIIGLSRTKATYNRNPERNLIPKPNGYSLN